MLFRSHERGAARGVPQFDFNSAMNKPKLKELIESGAMPMNQRLTPSQKKRFVLSLSKLKD